MTDDVTSRPWWRWMAGMADVNGVRFLGSNNTQAMVTSCQYGSAVYMVPTSTLRPDPTDPATLGCLLALARGLRADPGACTRWSSSSQIWYVTDADGYVVASGLTEWSALVAACDAAWGRR